MSRTTMKEARALSESTQRWVVVLVVMTELTPPEDGTGRRPVPSSGGVIREG
jgi:hypothetical protein